MSQGLNVGRLVRVTINLSPLAAQKRAFNTLLILGDSGIINGSERFRSYTTLDAIAAEFGINAPEYKAAALYYSQTPRPLNIMIGAWLRTATPAELTGGILTAAEQLISNFTSITTGTVRVTVDGVQKNITGLNFSSLTNLNQVAAAITAATTGVVFTWTGSRFVAKSSTTGITSTITSASATGSGQDISVLLKMTAGLGLAPVAGFAAETPAAAAAALADKSGAWYGLMFAASVMPSNSDYLAVGQFIEATNLPRILGVVEPDTRALDSTYTADLLSLFKALKYKRTLVQYSSSSPYAVASLMGRMFSVDFNANRSTITLMYKQEPGVIAENITESQAQTLKDKRGNVFVAYQNDTAIIQNGVMSGDAYIDEIHGLDWLANDMQTEAYNVLYQSKTKIPQTDAGANQLVAAVSGSCGRAVNNGLVAPGVWNADGFGQLQRGDPLTSGFYIYQQPMALQAQSDREARKNPPMTVALKLAGAIHELDVIVNVNR